MLFHRSMYIFIACQGATSLPPIFSYNMSKDMDCCFLSKKKVASPHPVASVQVSHFFDSKKRLWG